MYFSKMFLNTFVSDKVCVFLFNIEGVAYLLAHTCTTNPKGGIAVKYLNILFIGLGLLGIVLSVNMLPCNAAEDNTNGGKVKRMPHELPALPYAYNALEPYYDEATIKLHHDMHHAAYVKGLNAAEEKLDAMLKSGDYAGAKVVAKELAFHGSGHILHSILWTNMKPNGGGEPSGALADTIKNDFGSYDAFKALFMATANAVEGSGWAILAYNKSNDRLVVLQAEKHENLTQWGVDPILVLDVWEHAYYLKYQNKRPDWTKAFMENLVNWDDVSDRYTKAKS
jgi:Fe-Mn family superoxide dismutase